MYANRLSSDYAQEAASARAAGIRGIPCPGAEFDQVVAEGERLVFVVTLERKLVVAPQIKNGFEIRHPVLAEGQQVLAAGEIELVQGGSMRLVLELTNKSGHYAPPPACLGVVIELLEDLGYTVPSDVVRPYPGE